MEREFKIDNKQAVEVLRKVADLIEKEAAGEVTAGDLKVSIPASVEIGIDYEESGGETEFDIEIFWKGQAKTSKGTYNLFTGKDDKWYFNLKAGNGEIILASEAYESKQGAEGGIEAVRKNANETAFEKRESKSGQPYFVMKAANHEIIGTSQMYRRPRNRDNGIASVIAHAENSPVKDS